MLENIFGLILKEIRSEKNISQEKLAEFSNLDRTYISLLERGLRQPTLTTIFKLSAALQITPQELIHKVYESYQHAKK
ncbi:helix-turn-helix domain-containing protein [Marinifilum caeruleilacunae]|uniref:XRE family transcriptional regulator n=1 Tax=Marinifilum caeruleilacunae TaxID=2499076 RepID=A0ABX1X011_9BACT|nr:helix-turn-helix transcriptional regulator [Marinifilum caeruleilacunae]NOU61753.1 XRE family transcriptional regulator [Marinifilum caeruleilacunae]